MNNLYDEIKEKCCSRCDAECDGCWLEELITDRLSEERKKVVQEIRSKSYSFKNTPMYDEYGGVIGTFNRLDYGKLEEILDQIER